MKTLTFGSNELGNVVLEITRKDILLIKDFLKDCYSDIFLDSREQLIKLAARKALYRIEQEYFLRQDGGTNCSNERKLSYLSNIFINCCGRN